MIVEFKSNEIKPCICGYQPTHYSVAYGSTPYSIYCPICDKNTNNTKCLVIGCADNIIDYWNSYVSMMSKEELKKELINFHSKRKTIMRKNYYSNYYYYWIANKGQRLFNN